MSGKKSKKRPKREVRRKSRRGRGGKPDGPAGTRVGTGIYLYEIKRELKSGGSRSVFTAVWARSEEAARDWILMNEDGDFRYRPWCDVEVSNCYPPAGIEPMNIAAALRYAAEEYGHVMSKEDAAALGRVAVGIETNFVFSYLKHEDDHRGGAGSDWFSPDGGAGPVQTKVR